MTRTVIKQLDDRHVSIAYDDSYTGERITRFQLVFAGGIARRYRRFHSTFEAARDKALRILVDLDNRAAHPAIIYGPGCGRDGVTVP